MGEDETAFQVHTSAGTSCCAEEDRGGFSWRDAADTDAACNAFPDVREGAVRAAWASSSSADADAAALEDLA